MSSRDFDGRPGQARAGVEVDQRLRFVAPAAWAAPIPPRTSYTPFSNSIAEWFVKFVDQNLRAKRAVSSPLKPPDEEEKKKRDGPHDSLPLWSPPRHALPSRQRDLQNVLEPFAVAPDADRALFAFPHNHDGFRLALVGDGGVGQERGGDGDDGDEVVRGGSGRGWRDEGPGEGEFGGARSALCESEEVNGGGGPSGPSRRGGGEVGEEGDEEVEGRRRVWVLNHCI